MSVKAKGPVSSSQFTTLQDPRDPKSDLAALLLCARRVVDSIRACNLALKTRSKPRIVRAQESWARGAPTVQQAAAACCLWSHARNECCARQMPQGVMAAIFTACFATELVHISLPRVCAALRVVLGKSIRLHSRALLGCPFDLPRMHSPAKHAQ